MFTKIADSTRTNPVCSTLEKGFSGTKSALNRSFEWLSLDNLSSFGKITAALHLLNWSKFFGCAFIMQSQPFGPSLSLATRLPTAFKFFNNCSKILIETPGNYLYPHLNSFCIGIIYPAHEELISRVLIQDIFMKSISTIAPKKIQPLIAHKVTRIFVASTFFALIHTRFWNSTLGVFPQFLGGLLYGYIYEKWGFTASTAFHCADNLEIQFILIGLFTYLRKFQRQFHSTENMA